MKIFVVVLAVTFPPIEPTKESISSLIPYPKEIIEPLPIPRKTKTFLTTTGLPIHSRYFFWAGDLFVFYEQPRTINFGSCGKDNFLVIGELKGLDKPPFVAINVNRGGVYSKICGSFKYENNYFHCDNCWLFSWVQE